MMFTVIETASIFLTKKAIITGSNKDTVSGTSTELDNT